MSDLLGDFAPARRAMSGHQSANAKCEQWLTPPEILAALGEFDLDPCSPINRPWPTARRHFSKADNGLAQQWSGRVWLNPPYGAEMAKWMQRMAAHDQGTALLFARTETAAFHTWVWPVAAALLFLRGRLTFRTIDGKPGLTNAGAPSVLIAYGPADALALRAANERIAGQFVQLRGGQ